MENKINKFLEELIQEIETELDEATASGAAGAYSTPNAFSDKGKSDKKRKKKIATTLGYSVVGDDVDNISEAIKGRNNRTGESFGMVIGSDKQGNNGYELTVRKMYNSRISSYGFIFDKDSNLTDIRDYGYSLDGKFPDMKGHASSTSVRPNKRETITQIAKITSPAFAKKIYQHVQKNNKMDESVNEAKYYITRNLGRGQGKALIKHYDRKKNQTTDKPIEFKSYKDAQKEVEKLKRGGSMGGQMTAYIITDKDMNPLTEGKYNYKADALTAYFKGKIDAKELDRIARDDFKSGIATKKELSNFLSNKFTQDVMSDTYGIPAGTLIKRVRGLMKFAESIGESVNEAKVKRPVNRWLELKNDESMHPHKKMAMGLKELKHQLAETQKFFNWYNKIKTMNELDSNQYWKRTNKHIYKIKERLVNIARTIQEIEK